MEIVRTKSEHLESGHSKPGVILYLGDIWQNLVRVSEAVLLEAKGARPGMPLNVG